MLQLLDSWSTLKTDAEVDAEEDARQTVRDATPRSPMMIQGFADADKILGLTFEFEDEEKR